MNLSSVPEYTLVQFRREHPEAAAALGYLDAVHREPHWFIPSLRDQEKLQRLHRAVTKAQTALAAAEAAETAYRDALYAKDFDRTVVRPAQRSGRARFALLAATQWEPAIAALSTPDHWNDNDRAPWPAFPNMDDVILAASCPDPTTYHLTLEVLWGRTLNEGGQWDDQLDSPDYQAKQAAAYAEWERAAPRWLASFRGAWEQPSQAKTFAIQSLAYPADKGINYGFRVEWTWTQAHRAPVQAAITAWIARLTAFAQTGLRP